MKLCRFLVVLKQKASHLAGVLGVPFTTTISKLSSDADVYVLAVSDDAITEMAANLFPVGDRLIVHTSGSTPMDVLAPFFNQLWSSVSAADVITAKRG